MSIRDDRAFTLIEVIVATAVFAMVVFVITGVFFTASSRGLLGQNVTAGALLAQQRLEFLKSKGYASLSGFAATETLDELGNASPTGQFTRITAVTTPFLLTSKLTRLDVTMNWTDQGVARTVMLSTLMGDF